MTYADIKSVAPDALTPWKAENLWQLYIGASNFLDRSVDEVRYHADSDPALLNRIVALVPDRAAGAAKLPRRPAADVICKPARRSRYATTFRWRSICRESLFRSPSALCAS